MDATEIFLCAVGAFYVFAGWVATRAALTSRLLDQALGAISGRTPRRIETTISLDDDAGAGGFGR